MALAMPTVEWGPIALLAIAGMAILLADVIVAQRTSAFSLVVSLIGIGLAFALVAHRGWIAADAGAFNSFIAYDTVGRFGAMIVLIGGCLIALISPRTLRLYTLPPAEYYALLLFSLLAMVILCLSTELMTIFLSVETIAVTIYVLVGLRRGAYKSSEAALKYFILGAFSGAFLIFGFAFLYGGSGGSTLLSRMAVSLSAFHPRFEIACLVLGLGLAMVGFAFKLTAAPFHLYAADVFEGAPTPVAALLATGSKVAGVVALVHVLSPLRQAGGQMAHGFSENVLALLWILAAMSIIVGNLVALLQQNIKRMLAYSSIAHGGYILIGVLVFMNGRVKLADAQNALLVYLIAYVLMNVAVFGVALTLGERGEGAIDRYAGLSQRSPWLAAAMSVALLALTGIPATMGFVAKFYVFKGAVEAGYIGLVILAVLGSAVSAYYYLRVVVFMYMRDPESEEPVEKFGIAQTAGLALATVPIVVFGLFPDSLLRILTVL